MPSSGRARCDTQAAEIRSSSASPPQESAANARASAVSGKMTARSPRARAQHKIRQWLRKTQAGGRLSKPFSHWTAQRPSDARERSVASRGWQRSHSRCPALRPAPSRGASIRQTEDFNANPAAWGRGRHAGTAGRFHPVQQTCRLERFKGRWRRTARRSARRGGPVRRSTLRRNWGVRTARQSLAAIELYRIRARPLNFRPQRSDKIQVASQTSSTFTTGNSICEIARTPIISLWTGGCHRRAGRGACNGMHGHVPRVQTRGQQLGSTQQHGRGEQRRQGRAGRWYGNEHGFHGAGRR